MKHVEELPTDTYIASNAEDIIYLLTGRDTSLVPAKYNVFSLVSNRAYSEEIGELKEKLRNGGRVVWFREVTYELLLGKTMVPFTPDSAGVKVSWVN
jgi:hypothetical protein